MLDYFVKICCVYKTSFPQTKLDYPLIRGDKLDNKTWNELPYEQ